ncbi:hypothetical protein ACWGJW_04900 [Streptomyces nigrescens]
MASNQQTRPEIGELAQDLQTGQTGVVMGKLGGRVQMRPLAGGREWDAKPDDVIPPSAREELSARNTVRSARSRPVL